jgi:hypothetical protein
MGRRAEMERAKSVRSHTSDLKVDYLSNSQPSQSKQQISRQNKQIGDSKWAPAGERNGSRGFSKLFESATTSYVRTKKKNKNGIRVISF